MPQEGPIRARSLQSKVKKRTSNACNRCRQQKIKCSGRQPCEQCNKRSLACSFEDRDPKVLVSKEFINNLQRRLENASHKTPDENRVPSPIIVANDHDTPVESDRSNDSPDRCQNSTDAIAVAQSMNLPEVHYDVASSRSTPEPRLVNPLSGDRNGYISDSNGKPWYLGSSSNWSFARRVLSIAHERAYSAPLAAQDLSFDGKIYNIGWDGIRSQFTPDLTSLPSSDYAIYLINAVKFHCGQMFHLFDEQSFMQRFTQFHQAPGQQADRSDLWFIHYLLILAFGKALIVRGNAGHSPPGADMFVWALKCLPDTIFMCAQSVESVEVLCCVALYLQSLDFRCSAYNFIGQALRIAMSLGMHTSMENQGLDDQFVERCRNTWWTVYVLDRQMSSLMGMPVGFRDEDVGAFLPTFSGSYQRTVALEIHVKLSRIISQILNTVYGQDGRLSRKYLDSTKAALKSIASVTDQLNKYFDIPVLASMAGVSRLSAYLHLLYHQCVVLATRPLFFSCFKSRLDAPEIMPLDALESSSARALLQMCLESSNQILVVLSGLQKHSLLESFLPFDLESVFAAALVLALTPAVDPSLSENPQDSLEIAYNILDEMAYRGNVIAATRKSELRLLEDLMNRIPLPNVSTSRLSTSLAHGNAQAEPSQDQLEAAGADVHGLEQNSVVPLPGLEMPAYDYWSYDLTSEQLLALADSLDLDGIDWMTMSDTNISPNVS